MKTADEVRETLLEKIEGSDLSAAETALEKARVARHEFVRGAITVATKVGLNSAISTLTQDAEGVITSYVFEHDAYRYLVETEGSFYRVTQASGFGPDRQMQNNRVVYFADHECSRVRIFHFDTWVSALVKQAEQVAVRKHRAQLRKGADHVAETYGRLSVPLGTRWETIERMIDKDGPRFKEQPPV